MTSYNNITIVITFTFIILVQINGQRETKFSALKKCFANKGIDVRTQLIKRDLKSAKYVDSNFQNNDCCGGLITPMSYLIITETSQIQAAVICCKQLYIRIVPKAGGHSYGKYSFGDSESLVLDLRPMNHLSINKKSKTAVVSPGTLIGPLAYKLYKQGGFGVPIGECVIIGITSALGGGYGIYSRLYGLTSDNLVELEMVDANGQKCIANNATNTDLFWALRGAGAGSFGIVTSYKFKLFDMPKFGVYGCAEYSMSEFPYVFEAYQRFILSNPARTIVQKIEITKKPPTGEQKFTIYTSQLQTTEETLSSGQAQIRNIFTKIYPKPKPGKLKITSMNAMDLLLQFGFVDRLRDDNITNSAQLEYLTQYDFKERGVKRRKSILVPNKIGILSRDGIFEFYELLLNRPAIAEIDFELHGGAINDLKPTDTAYVHRNVMYEIRPSFLGTRQQERYVLPWLKYFFEVTKPLFKHTESYQNHLDIDLPDYLQRYYGQNLPRLIEVKRKYDPENVFHHPQSIPIK